MSESPQPSGFDAGWLFVVAGVAICAAGLLIPAQRDLADIRQKRDALRHEEVVANERLTAHSVFLADIEREDPLLVRRLAAAQLNLMPKGDTPVLLASSSQSPVTTWIDATVTVPPIAIGASAGEAGGAGSPLARLATGPYRLWLLSGGAFAVFLGLLLDPSVGKAKAPRHVAATRCDELLVPSPQLGPVAIVTASGSMAEAVQPGETLAVFSAEDAALLACSDVKSDEAAASLLDAQLDDHEQPDAQAALRLLEVDRAADTTIAHGHDAADPIRESITDDTESDCGLDVPLAENEAEPNADDAASADSMNCARDCHVSDQDRVAWLDAPRNDGEVPSESPDLLASPAADDPIPTMADDAAIAPPEIETFDPFGRSNEVVPVDQEPANNAGVHKHVTDEGRSEGEADSAAASASDSAVSAPLPFRLL